MAQMLCNRVKNIKGVKITMEVNSNGVFAIIPPDIIPTLQEQFFFYVWDEKISEVRWMTSWDTQEEDIEEFGRLLESLLS